jgi:hypothetical protein
MFCSLCNGVLGFLGKLGSLAWFRCQGCGMEFNLPASEVEDDEDFDG